MHTCIINVSIIFYRSEHVYNFAGAELSLRLRELRWHYCCAPPSAQSRYLCSDQSVLGALWLRARPLRGLGEQGAAKRVAWWERVLQLYVWSQSAEPGMAPYPIPSLVTKTSPELLSSNPAWSQTPSNGYRRVPNTALCDHFGRARVRFMVRMVTNSLNRARTRTLSRTL